MHSHSSVVIDNLRVTVGSLICGLDINGFNQLWIENIQGKNLQKVPKSITLICRCTGNYLHIIYIVLGIISNL